MTKLPESETLRRNELDTKRAAARAARAERVRQLMEDEGCTRKEAEAMADFEMA